MNTLGRHYLAEFYGCETDALNNPERIEQLMNEAARISGATIVQSVFHMFNPYGVSGVVVVAESHLAIHTWPEHQYAAVDYFSCGPIDCEAAIRHLARELGARRTEAKEVERGVLGRLEQDHPPSGLAVETGSPSESGGENGIFWELER